MRVAPCSVRVAERALRPRVVTRGIAATLQRKVARSPVLSRPQRRAVARASTKAALRKHTLKHTLVDERIDCWLFAKFWGAVVESVECAGEWMR